MNLCPPLVIVVDGDPMASTEVIAKGMKVQHKNILELIRRYIDAMAEFGPIEFKTRLANTPQGGGRQTAFAMLNERQAMLLISMMRNNEKVVAFKISLTREFYRMRDALNQRTQNLWQQMHALIAQEVESKVRASFGSSLMLERKREIPNFDYERERLEREIQPSLLN